MRAWVPHVTCVLRSLLVAGVLFLALGVSRAEEPPEGEDSKALAEDPVIAKARALRERGDSQVEARRLNKAIADYRAAIQLMKSKGLDHLELATSLNNLAYVLESLGRANESLRYYEQALLMFRRLSEGDHPRVALSLNNLGYVLETLGKPSKALTYLEESLSMTVRLFEGDHPDVASSLNNLGRMLQVLGKSQEALGYCEQALSMRTRLFEGDHPDVASSSSNLAAALTALGRLEEALGYYERALWWQRFVVRIPRQDEYA